MPAMSDLFQQLAPKATVFLDSNGGVRIISSDGTLPFFWSHRKIGGGSHAEASTTAAVP